MKLAVLADVHSNWRALQAVADHLERWQPDRVVVAGDVINRGPRPVECLDFVLRMQRERGWSLVLGNHEEYVIHHAHPREPIAGPWVQIWGSSRWTYEKLDGNVSALEALPLQQSWIMPDGSEARVVHASMRGTRDGIFPKTPDDQLRKQIAPPPKLFVVGHTHVPLVRTLGETLVVNVGSAGLPFDLDRTFARVDVDLTDAIGVYGLFEHRAYSETLLPLADYESDRYGVFLRWASK